MAPIKILNNKKIKKLSCSECNHLAFSESALNRHFNKQHAKDKVKCSKCDALLLKSSLQHHVWNVHNENKVRCNECEYTCSNNTNMKRHIDLVHLKKKEKCPKCGIEVNKGYAIRHLQEVHMRINPKSCPICGYCTSKRSNLNTHIKSQHLDMKEVCDKCNKKFPVGALASHTKRVHMKIKKQKCTYCTHSTVTAQEMNVHVKMVHLKVKLNCDRCPAKLANKQSLERHLKFVHKVESTKITPNKPGLKPIMKPCKNGDNKCSESGSMQSKCNCLGDKEFMDFLWDSIPEEIYPVDDDKTFHITA